MLEENLHAGGKLDFLWSGLTSNFTILCTYQCQTPPIPGRAEVKIGGNLQILDDKFPYVSHPSTKLRIPY